MMVTACPKSMFEDLEGADAGRISGKEQINISKVAAGENEEGTQAVNANLQKETHVCKSDH
jgi:hypothetical protein